MKTQLTKNGRIWSLYAAVLAAMAYSALTLTSQPAYAATCTPTLCQEDKGLCRFYCGGSGVRSFICPLHDNAHYFCECNGGPPPMEFPC